MVKNVDAHIDYPVCIIGLERPGKSSGGCVDYNEINELKDISIYIVKKKGIENWINLYQNQADYAIILHKV